MFSVTPIDMMNLVSDDIREMTDEEAVAAALRDSRAFAVIVGKYRQPLLRYIGRLGCTDPEVAQDVLQEAFIKAFINLNDFDSARSFSAWIYRIAHNETMSHFRRQRSRPQVVEREEDLVIFDKIADELDTVQQADEKLRARAVAAALSQLRSHYRDVLVLRYFEDKSYAEIADILRIPQGTVTTYLARAKKRLREILEESPAVEA